MSVLKTVTAAEVVPKTPTWAWADRVPLGAVTVLAGPPGQGKTQLMVGMCAQATNGKLAGDLEQTAIHTLYVSAEDSIEHTLTPRSIAARGDLKRMHFLVAVNYMTRGQEEQAGLSIPQDVPLLDGWLARTPARIVVLDPIVAMIPTNLNTHRDQDVRRALAPLAALAEKYSVAIVVVMHLNKNLEADALNRLSGSIGFGGAARSVLLFAADPDDPDGEAGNRRILAHVKCNLGPKQPSIAYRIDGRTLDTANGQVKTSIAVRDGNATASANDLLSKPTSAGEATARGEARTFLMAELTAGPVAVAQLRIRGEEAGVSWRTIERAKGQLPIKTKKTETGWQWQIVNTATPPPNTPIGGLVGVGGLESKAANTANNVTKGNLADLDPDAELERLQTKFGISA